MTRNRLGVAIFEAETGHLSWAEVTETSTFQSLEFVKFKVKPTLVITHSKSDHALIHVLKQHQQQQENGSENTNNQQAITLCKPQEFAYANAKTMLQMARSAIENDTQNNISNRYILVILLIFFSEMIL